MAKINKAFFWSLFAAGGTVTAFVFPVLALIIVIAASGSPPEIMGFDQMHGLLSNWFAKLVALGVISLGLWHAAHRLRVGLHGAGLRADGLTYFLLYGMALVGTILSIVFLVQI